MMYGILDEQVGVNNAGEARPDGQLKYSDQKWGYGGNFGILVEPKSGTRFGLTYLTEVKLDFAAVPEFSGLGPVLQAFLVSRGLTTNEMSLSMTIPQMVMFSTYHEINPRWAVMGNVGWQDWSRFGKAEVGINSEHPLEPHRGQRLQRHVARGPGGAVPPGRRLPLDVFRGRCL